MYQLLEKAARIKRQDDFDKITALINDLETSTVTVINLEGIDLQVEIRQYINDVYILRIEISRILETRNFVKQYEQKEALISDILFFKRLVESL